MASCCRQTPLEQQTRLDIFTVLPHQSTTMAPPLVSDAQIASASLHNALPIYLHAYVWPFLIIWPIFFSFYLSEDSYDQYINGQEWTFVFSGTIVTIQSLVWLSTHWSVDLDAFFTSTKAKNLDSAGLIKIIPVANAGRADTCKLQKDAKGGRNFEFQKRRFLWDESAKTFTPLTYALDAKPKPLLAEFQQSKGFVKQADLDKQQQHYGDNTFDIPVPTFGALFKEHAVAPFFVFQIFCVGLWMLDEFWYYSLFTLFMLIVFESTVVWQRQRTLTEFRGMSIQPYNVWVHRTKGWEEVKSDKLLPGDLVSVGRSREDSGVACDMLLVKGTAIVNEAMLSGESTPVLKDSIALRPSDAPIDPEGLDKNALLFGGTKVLQVTHSAATEADIKTNTGVPTPPDNGALAIVVKTGFETSQGSLVRTMIYSTERVSAGNAEALWFILFLLVFAIASSWYVWGEGVRRNRKRSKLLLDCVLIITSVVPPELPMELSLAVNTSLAALSKLAIFCTEPFRIPFAGRVDIACFDKTGTLTGEDLGVEGVAGLSMGGDGNETKLYGSSDLSAETGLVLASAHALVKLEDGEIVGEPMEKATLKFLGWSLGEKETVSSKVSDVSVQIKRRFQFSSALKRQSTVATIVSPGRDGKRTKSTFIAVKGAPETIRKMLVDTPSTYEDTYKYFMRNGSRVLALGYKYLSTDDEIGLNRVNNLKREDVEDKLKFAGFLVLSSPLKDDAAKAVRMLNESSHRVIMITGDNPLTAVHVAHEVEIVDREVLILDAPENDDSGEKLVWRSVDEKVIIPVDPKQPISADIIKNKDLCVTGYALAKYKDEPAGLKQILRNAWVYARVSPKQKEEILIGLRDMGYFTLMAGDGTNDVGALKQAHIGVALLNGTKDALTKIAENMQIDRLKKIYEQQVALMKRFNQPAPPVPLNIAHVYPPGPSNPHYEKALQQIAERKAAAANGGVVPNGTAAKDTKAVVATPAEPEKKLTPQEEKQKIAQEKAAALSEKMANLMSGADEEDEAPTLKLGDASVAAPFTSKLANVVAIPNIIRQGRCTLVATIQMYKILALNCLISAYSLSVLYLDGIKFGDGQVTISGMMMSVCFLSISRAKVYMFLIHPSSRNASS